MVPPTLKSSDTCFSCARAQLRLLTAGTFLADSVSMGGYGRLWAQQGEDGDVRTTAPSAESTRGGSSLTLLALQWLHPERRAVLLESAELLFGRGASGPGRLEGNEVSRQHARLRRDGPLLLVEDLGSRNGVYVQGERCQGAPLVEGSVLRLGEWVGQIVRLLDPAEATRDFSELAPGVMGGRQLSRVLEVACRGASSDLPVVIEGETGTGKECVARAVHAWSGRAGPFLAVNCAALPEHLAEGELFGYRRGAFTGAERASPGHFRAAQGGTLLLDEFMELSLALQAKLLRVLEQREVVPLGESTPVPIDVRLVVASQETLEHALAEQRLRSDLYARLDGILLQLPPLRDRVEDVPALFRHFLVKAGGGRAPALETALVEQLCLYDWPFNVREVQLLAKKLMVLHGHEPLLRRSHVPERLRVVQGLSRDAPSHQPQSPQIHALAPVAGETREQRDERELAALTAALRAADGNVARACQALGLSRQRAYRLMHRGNAFDLESLRAGGGGEQEVRR